MSEHHPAGSPAPETDRPLHFIEQIVEEDIASGKWGSWENGRARVHTRFPPEPNGYLHLGHAKSIALNYGLAKKYGGKFNLRFDDTNPAKEEREYVESIIRDVKWLGADFDTGAYAGGLFFASTYFEQMYAWAEELIEKGRAYVCDLSADEVSAMRGDLKTPARSPHRDRSPEESLRLFREMKAGKYPNGAKTLRARIDLASPNFVLRDPVMYRIVHEHHHNTGDAWCLYPMYDWAHCLEDSIEGITHSICTLEFRNNRPLYDWFIDTINIDRTRDGSGRWGRTIHHPQQIEFARGNITYTLMSKRWLLKLVDEGHVRGWDDPRMPTISAARRRGIPARALLRFWEEAGVTTQVSMMDLSRLEHTVRDELNRTSPRAMAVLRPLKVTITNWPKDAAGKSVVDHLDFVVNPEDAGAGTRKVPFSGTLYIEREDFEEHPPKKFFRLAPVENGGQEVRLRWAYFVKCIGVVKNDSGEVVEILCRYDPETRGGDAPKNADGTPSRKVKGTIHWVSAEHSISAEVRLFDRLYTAEEPGARTGNSMDDLNPNSLEVVTARLEPHLAGSGVGDVFQFERLGYFRVDEDSKVGLADGLVFNRTVTLKDTWAKEKS